MALDPRLLRSFVVLAEELHFGRAAERLHLAQPALSQQIRRLERQLGVELYTRSSRLVELTDAGRAMIEPANAALRATAQAERAAREAARGLVHQMRVGVEMNLEDMVPTVLAHADAHADVALWLSRLHEHHGQEALAASQIDAFVSFLPPTPNSDDVLRARTTDIPLSAIVCPDHPLAAQVSVPVHELRGLPITIFGRRQSPPLFDRFVDILSGGEGRRALTLREMDVGSGTQVALLAEVGIGGAIGFGTSATVAAIVAANARHLLTLPFDPPLHVPTHISWRTRSAGVEALVDDLRWQTDAEHERPTAAPIELEALPSAV